MDEYEKLEEELVYIYELYITKFRCLTFLEQQLEDIEKAELEQMQEREEQIKRMVEQMKQEEMLRTETENGSIDEIGAADDDDDDEEEEETDDIGPPKDLGIGTGRMRRSMINTVTVNKRSAATGRVRVFGSMAGGDKEDSLDSDLDLEGDEDASDLDSEDEMELMNLTNDDRKRASNPEPFAKKAANTANNGNNDSDNDF